MSLSMVHPVFARSPDRGESGFTLLEMIVVLVVLGLMAGLIVARGPQHSPALDLSAAASEVAQALRGARGQAIATGRPVVFRLDVVAHAFSVGGSPRHLLPASLGLSVVAVSDEVAAGRSAGISFAPDGSSSGGTVDFVSGARRLRVAVDWLTGRVTIADAHANSK